MIVKRYGDYRTGQLDKFASKVKAGTGVTMKEIGDNIRNKAKDIVPIKTGRLQRSLRVTKTSKNSVFIGTAVPYSGYVEFGTINMRPQPYLLPAAESTLKMIGKQIDARLVNLWRSS